MERFCLVLLSAAVAVGCAHTDPSAPGSPQESPATITASAADALTRQRDEMLAIKGVLEVSLAPDGLSLHAVLCAEAVARRLTAGDAEVPVTYAIVAAPLPAVCGCSYEGRYYSPGESYPVSCNTCRCLESGQTACTLRACEMAILSKVLFPFNSKELDRPARAVTLTIVDIMRRYDTMRVRVRGHSAPGEADADALSEARAQAVRDLLIAEGVAETRLEVQVVGDAVPLFADPRKEATDPTVRRVSFDVISL